MPLDFLAWSKQSASLLKPEHIFYLEQSLGAPDCCEFICCFSTLSKANLLLDFQTGAKLFKHFKQKHRLGAPVCYMCSTWSKACERHFVASFYLEQNLFLAVCCELSYLSTTWSKAWEHQSAVSLKGFFLEQSLLAPVCYEFRETFLSGTNLASSSRL